MRDERENDSHGLTTTAMAKSMTVRGGDDDHVGGGGDGCSTLPEDQVFEVLTRVSLDDLAACRMVSTQWRRLTYEPGFAGLHCRRADAVSGYFVQSMTFGRYRADFVSMHSSSSSPTAAKEISLGFLPPAHVRVVAVAAHRGLVCCVGDDRRGKPRYYVCKPATRQWRALPNPRVRFRAMATAMVARPSGAAAEFKIVRLSVPKLEDRLYCEVFDSRQFTWRQSADVMLWPYSLVPSAPAVRAHGGAMHWLRWPDHRTWAEDVFAFDMKSETWRLIALPPEVGEVEYRWARKMIVAVEDRLCLLLTMNVADDEVMEMWEMASYVHGRWAKKTTVSLKKSLHVHVQGTAFIRDLCSHDVAFLEGFYRVMWYDFRRGKTMAEVKVSHGWVKEVFKFESDFSPCEIGGDRSSGESAGKPATRVVEQTK